MEELKVSKATLLRLPSYLRYLQSKRQEGIETITSTMIAQGLHLNSIQVRKDLAVVSSVSGKPKTGFMTAQLMRDLQTYLGYDKATEAVLVGVGGLGRALLTYSGFESYGLNIVGAFDVNPEVIGLNIGDTQVLPIEELEPFVVHNKILIGIITVPKSAAQAVCDQFVAAGIKAIWNFAPTHLTIPDGVAYRNEDMAASLAVLSKDLSRLTH